MFIADIDLRLTHEKYDDGKYRILEAGVCDIYDIGGQPSLYDPDITSYMCSDKITYYYSLDYVIFVENHIMGDIGRNCINTPFSNNDDLVYYLMDTCMQYIIENPNEHEPFKLLMNYLFRHCKNNNCKVLELKIDSFCKYKQFYEFIKNNYHFVEWNGYLLKEILWYYRRQING